MPSPLRCFGFAIGSILALAATTSPEPSRAAEQPKTAPENEPTHRNRPPMPEITVPVMFNTPEADRILSSLQVYPPDNPWNEDISKRPVHRNRGTSSPR